MNIFGYVILEPSRNSFEQCSKIYRNKGGSYEILNFFQNEMVSSLCKEKKRSKREKGEFQNEVNRNFRMNAVRNVADRMKRREEEFK